LDITGLGLAAAGIQPREGQLLSLTDPIDASINTQPQAHHLLLFSDEFYSKLLLQ